jgi:hypothetical protein
MEMLTKLRMNLDDAKKEQFLASLKISLEAKMSTSKEQGGEAADGK